MMPWVCLQFEDVFVDVFVSYSLFFAAVYLIVCRHFFQNE